MSRTAQLGLAPRRSSGCSDPRAETTLGPCGPELLLHLLAVRQAVLHVVDRAATLAVDELDVSRGGCGYRRASVLRVPLLDLGDLLHGLLKRQAEEWLAYANLAFDAVDVGFLTFLLANRGHSDRPPDAAGTLAQTG
jgi:hypothetical protein